MKTVHILSTEDQLISAMLSGQRSVEIGNVIFDLPTIGRDTQKRREAQAKKEAEKLIKILNS